MTRLSRSRRKGAVCVRSVGDRGERWICAQLRKSGTDGQVYEVREDSSLLGTEQLDWLNETNLGVRVICHRLSVVGG